MGVRDFIAGLFGGRRVVHSVHSARGRNVQAGYDLAQTTAYNRRHWAAADGHDADSANSKAVRQITVRRSRYETENNGFAKGANRTLANYTVGRGPKLRIQTSSPGFNAMVQQRWNEWAKRVTLGRKLRTAVKARAKDGETFLLAKINENLRHEVKIDIVGIECEQCQSTDLLLAREGRIDGIHFDEFGNPTAYDILPHHPGSAWMPFVWQAEKVPAKFVFHLFQEDRPSQHRAIPEAASTLNTCGQSRRWRDATLQAAENIADFSIFVKPAIDASGSAGQCLPFDTLEIERGLMTALPAGADAFQPKPEQPAATYDEFLRAQVNEQVRPFSMGHSLGAVDSKDASFSSAKMDQHPFHFQVDVDQSDIEDLVLDPIFELWYAEASRVYGWAGDPDSPPSHAWDWPAMPIINEVDTANSRETNIRTGIGTVARYQAEDGYDPEEEIQKAATYYGKTVEEMREAYFKAQFEKQPSPSPESTEPPTPPKSNGVNRIARYNGNGTARAAT
jgi:capsid protein